MSDTNKNLVRRHFEEIWNQRKMAACDELMADDFSEHAAAPFAAIAPGKVHGPTAMRGTAEWLLGQFPDLSVRIESIVADEDKDKLLFFDAMTCFVYSTRPRECNRYVSL